MTRCLATGLKRSLSIHQLVVHLISMPVYGKVDVVKPSLDHVFTELLLLELDSIRIDGLLLIADVFGILHNLGEALVYRRFSPGIAYANRSIFPPLIQCAEDLLIGHVQVRLIQRIVDNTELAKRVAESRDIQEKMMWHNTFTIRGRH